MTLLPFSQFVVNKILIKLSPNNIIIKLISCYDSFSINYSSISNAYVHNSTRNKYIINTRYIINILVISLYDGYNLYMGILLYCLKNHKSHTQVNYKHTFSYYILATICAVFSVFLIFQFCLTKIPICISLHRSVLMLTRYHTGTRIQF